MNLKLKGEKVNVKKVVLLLESGCIVIDTIRRNDAWASVELPLDDAEERILTQATQMPAF